MIAAICVLPGAATELGCSCSYRRVLQPHLVAASSIVEYCNQSWLQLHLTASCNRTRSQLLACELRPFLVAAAHHSAAATQLACSFLSLGATIESTHSCSWDCLSCNQPSGYAAASMHSGSAVIGSAHIIWHISRAVIGSDRSCSSCGAARVFGSRCRAHA